VRHATKQFPVILFDTLDLTGKSSGKTTTVRSLMRLITGAEPTPMVHTGSETDLQKDISSFTDKPGPTPIFIDNIRPKSGQQHTVRHQLLKIATNSRVLYLRPHYKGLTPLFEPIFLLTMNGGRVENDLADSVVRVSLRRRKGEVQHRLLKPNPEEYVQENRLDLMAEIFDILSKVQIEPLDQQTFHTRFYRWEEIAIKAARIAGFDPSFSPARVHNADAVVHQLYRLLQDVNFEETSFGELATRIPSTGHSSELQNLLSTQGLSPTGRVRFLGDYIEDSIAGRPFRIGSCAFKFVVRNDDKNRFISVEHL
jgi:hypothetical protein